MGRRLRKRDSDRQTQSRGVFWDHILLVVGILLAIFFLVLIAKTTDAIARLNLMIERKQTGLSEEEEPLPEWPMELVLPEQCNITTAPFSLMVNGVGPKTKLTYHSSQESVAEIDDEGMVTICSGGETVFTVTAEGSKHYRETQRQITLQVDPRDGIQVKIEELMSMWPEGSYFSRNGEACRHYSRGTCRNCQLQYIVGDLGLDWEYKVDYLDGWTCYAWARYIYRYVFGEMLDLDHAAVIAEGDPAVPETFADAKPGDVIWFYERRYQRKARHMAIFIGMTDEGVFLYDSNIGGDHRQTGCIRCSVLSFEDIDEVWVKCEVLHANNYEEIRRW